MRCIWNINHSPKLIQRTIFSLLYASQPWLAHWNKNCHFVHFYMKKRCLFYVLPLSEKEIEIEGLFGPGLDVGQILYPSILSFFPLNIILVIIHQMSNGCLILWSVFYWNYSRWTSTVQFVCVCERVFVPLYMCVLVFWAWKPEKQVIFLWQRRWIIFLLSSQQSNIKVRLTSITSWSGQESCHISANQRAVFMQLWINLRLPYLSGWGKYIWVYILISICV